MYRQLKEKVDQEIILHECDTESRFSVLCILDLYFLTGNEDLPLFYAVLVLPFFFFFSIYFY